MNITATTSGKKVEGFQDLDRLSGSADRTVSQDDALFREFSDTLDKIASHLKGHRESDSRMLGNLFQMAGTPVATATRQEPPRPVKRQEREISTTEADPKSSESRDDVTRTEKQETRDRPVAETMEESTDSNASVTSDAKVSDEEVAAADVDGSTKEQVGVAAATVVATTAATSEESVIKEEVANIVADESLLDKEELPEAAQQPQVISEQQFVSDSDGAAKAEGSATKVVSRDAKIAAPTSTPVKGADVPAPETDPIQSQISAELAAAMAATGADKLEKSEGEKKGIEKAVQNSLSAIAQAQIPQAQSDVASDSLVSQAILRHFMEAPQIRDAGSRVPQSQLLTRGLQGIDTSGMKAQDSSAKNEAPRAAKPLPKSQEARTLEKVENVLKEVARSKDGRTISVRLDPPSLGAVKVDVSMRDGGLHARIVAESSQVGVLLREHAPELATMLRKLGLDVEKVTVSTGSKEGERETFLADGSGAKDQQRKQEQGSGRPVIMADQGGSATMKARAEMESGWVA